MVNLGEFLKKKYDNEIKKTCLLSEEKVVNCMNESFNDRFVCENEILEFNKCVINFDKNFKNTYKNINNLKTFNLPKD